MHRTWIKASPEQIWAALTDPSQNGRYGYAAPTEFDLRPGGAVAVHANEGMKQMGMPDLLIDGEVREVDAPNRLVYTWHAYFDENIAASPPTPLTLELRPGNPMMFPNGGVTQVTLTHDTEGAPISGEMVGGGNADAGAGHAFIPSYLK